MSKDWRRLGERVRERREQRGLTPADLQARGGPSVATIGKIERVEAESYKPRSIRLLEDALGWKRGSVEAILAGGEPVLVDDATLADARRRANERQPRSDAEIVRERLVTARVAIDQAMAALDQIEER